MAGHYEQIALNEIKQGGLCDGCPNGVKALERALRADARHPEAANRSGGRDLTADMIGMDTIAAATMIKQSPCISEPNSGVCEAGDRLSAVAVAIVEAGSAQNANAILTVNGLGRVRFRD